MRFHRRFGQTVFMGDLLVELAARGREDDAKLTGS